MTWTEERHKAMRADTKELRMQATGKGYARYYDGVDAALDEIERLEKLLHCIHCGKRLFRSCPDCETRAQKAVRR